MSRYSNTEIISAIHNGQEDVLLYLSRKYFQPARRWLRRRGVPDEKTPEIFVTVLLALFRDIQKKELSVHIDFESYLFNSLEDLFKQEKNRNRKERFLTENILSDKNKSSVSACLSILDKETKRLIFSHYAGNMNFEQLAVQFEFSNPVIAQFELNKAMNRLEGLVRLQLNID